MPHITLEEEVYLHFSTCKHNELDQYERGNRRHGMPLGRLLIKISRDRLTLAGSHLRSGDEFLAANDFRSSISRHYYSMYHAGRAVAFVAHSGDDYEKHFQLPDNLPVDMDSQALYRSYLEEARLLRNQADYDLYPSAMTAWRSEASDLSTRASQLVAACESYIADKESAL